METEIGTPSGIVREDPSDFLDNSVDRFPKTALRIDLATMLNLTYNRERFDGFVHDHPSPDHAHSDFWG